MTLPNIDLAEAVDGKDGYLTYKAVMRAGKRANIPMTEDVARAVLRQAVLDQRATWFEQGPA